MKTQYSIFGTIIILLFFFSANIYSQNQNDALRLGIPGLGANARALGMGNSYISISDDASAAFFNPAGFGLLKRMELSGGFEYINNSDNATFFGNSTTASNSSTRLNRISYAFPFPTTRGSLVFGLSYHVTKDFTSRLKFDGFNNGNTSMIQTLNANTNIPYDLYLTDLNYNTPIDGKLNQSGDILQSGSIHNWTFSGAIEVYKNVYVGANLNIASGNYENNNDYYEDDTRNYYQGLIDPTDSTTLDFQTFYLNKILKWDISGWDAKVGMIYQLNPFARIGATVQFPKKYTIKEDFLVSGYSQFGSGAQYNLDKSKYSDNVQYDISTPFELGGGFSYNYKGLIFSIDATLIDYTQMEFSNANGLSEQTVNDINKSIKDLLRAVVNYNVGVEYTIPNVGVRVRGGYFVQPSAYGGDPSSFDRKYVTAGIGFLTDQTMGLDFAFAHGWWSTYGDNYGVNVSRTNQDVTDNHFILTATYRF